MSDKPKVLLGMSGGVDSSVAAILLKEQGYDVVGITLHLYEGGCCDTDSTLEAVKICKKIGIEHITVDKKELFKKKVIDDFIEEYKNNRTPNPCIQCNKYLKFEIMYEIAQKMGIKYIATGHYAGVKYSQKYKRSVIKKAKNIQKDQSYFLYLIPKEILSNIIFPLAEFHSKDQIREIARKRELEVASKPDSEDVCFITNGDYKDFLEKNSDIAPRKGKIVDKDGNVLGEHEGLYRYTIGQRKGLGISNSEPLFVVGYNKEKNELIVGNEKELYTREAVIWKVNLQAVDEITKPIRVKVKTRFTAKEHAAVIVPIPKTESKELEFKILFDDPQRAITPGQSAVFYDEDGILIGGGIIK